MKYQITVSNQDDEPIEIETNSWITMSTSEEQKGNKINSIKVYNPNLTMIILALRPESIRKQESDDAIWIGETCFRSKQLWPTDEHMEQVANEVSEVMDNLHCKEKTSCEGCL